jgi:hypothetical protein
MSTSGTSTSSHLPLVLERIAHLEYARDDHGVSDYANPKVVPLASPQWYNPMGEVADMQGAYVFPAGPPNWYDNRTHKVRHIRIELKD